MIMAIEGVKISEMTEKNTLTGHEYIPIVDGTENKKVLTSKFATKTELGNKLDVSVYNSEKANFATKAEIGNIETILDNIIGG